MIYVIAPPAQARIWADREHVDPDAYEVLSRYAQVAAMTPADRVVEVLDDGHRAPLRLALQISMVPIEVEHVRLRDPVDSAR
jgi:hypothetical protein